MNAKQIFTALALAMAGNVAMAVEAEQLEVPISTLSRADVKDDLARAELDGTLMSGGEATVFVDGPVASTLSREDVRAEARAFARSNQFDELQAG